MNYVASYLITQHLLPLLEKSGSPDYPSRLVFVSSGMHKYGELPTALDTTRVNPQTFTWWKSYASSHLALITYANFLNTYANTSRIRITSVHPGVENRHFSTIFYQVSRNTCMNYAPTKHLVNAIFCFSHLPTC